MSNSTENLAIFPYGKGGRTVFLPVDGGSHIRAGTLVAQLGTGMLVPASTATAGPAIGVAEMEADNTSGADAAIRCKVRYGEIFLFANGSGGDACSEATTFGAVVYAGDDHTIFDNDGAATLKPAGRFMGMEPDGKVRVFVGMANLGDAFEDASNIAISDAGAFTAAADVEAAIAEIYQHIKSTKNPVLFSLHDLREVDANGDVGNIAANGGLLASDTTPILRADAAESAEVVWAATNVDAVQLQTVLPSDFDGSADVTIDLWVYTDNAGGGGIDAATFTVETSWDGGAKVSDTATDGTPATSVHKITATVDAGDIPNSASNVTITLIPAAHANDPVQLIGARLNYKAKFLTS